MCALHGAQYTTLNRQLWCTISISIQFILFEEIVVLRGWRKKQIDKYNFSIISTEFWHKVYDVEADKFWITSLIVLSLYVIFSHSHHIYCIRITKLKKHKSWHNSIRQPAPTSKSQKIFICRSGDIFGFYKIKITITTISIFFPSPIVSFIHTPHFGQVGLCVLLYCNLCQYIFPCGKSHYS